MSNYAAKIVDEIVEEVIVGDYVWANANLDGNWVDCTNDGEIIAGIGYTYNLTTGIFAPPIIEE